MSGGVLARTDRGHGESLAADRVLPAPALLAPLLPGAGLRRGSLLALSGVGSTTLLLSLLAAPLGEGCWAAAAGLPDLGLEAAAAMGVELGRLALVPDPGSGWAAVTAVLLDAVDLVVVRPPFSPRPAEARRLAAGARERGSVLLLAPAGVRWPEQPDIALRVEAGAWEGISEGAGPLRRRPARVVVSGRRAGTRPRALECWLPGDDGRLSPRGRKEAAQPPVAATAPEAVAWAG